VIPGFAILEELGRGGMGVVYKARQVSLDRVVALKMVLGAGQLEPQRLARFHTEAEAVAQLTHPNIVQVYEVGSHNQQPYIALEFVAGGSLAQRTAGTPVPAAVSAAVVEQLARAIHYAHLRGILHRDLKPANILVSGNASAVSSQSPSADHSLLATHDLKITDFGLAKRLDQDSGQTHTGQVMGSPSYMAPEQAAGRVKEFGPATDVYALGAILYELLIGRPPFKAATALETMQQVLSVEPVAPSRLQPKVPRDLETICMKCLHKEPHKRYASAEALADDLCHFRQGEPIVARPIGRWERAVKWARRRPTAAALVAVTVLAGLGLLGVFLWSYVQISAALSEVREQRDEARKQTERAQRNFDRARQAVRRLTKLSKEQLAHVPRMEQEQRALLEEALKFYEGFLREQDVDADVHRDAALAYELVGDNETKFGNAEIAEAYYAKGLKLLQDLGAQFPDNADYRQELAGMHIALGSLYGDVGRYGPAEKEYRVALSMLEKQAADRSQVDSRYRFGSAHYDLGLLLRQTGRHQEALQADQQALTIWQALAAEFPRKPVHQDDLGATHLNLGSVLQDLGRLAESEQEYHRALACKAKIQEIDASFSARPYNRAEIARIDNRLGDVCKRLGRLREAEAAYRRVLDLNRKLVDDFPTVPMFQFDLAWSYSSLSTLLAETGRADEARELRLQGVAHWQKLANGDSGRSESSLESARRLGRLGDGLLSAEKHGDAAKAYEQAVALWQKLAVAYPTTPEYRRQLAFAHANRGMAVQNVGLLAEAEQAQRQALTLQEQLAGESPAMPEYRSNLAAGYERLSHLLERRGQLVEAEKVHRQAMVLREKLAADHADVPGYREDWAHSYDRLRALLQQAGGRLPEEEQALLKALTLFEALVNDFPAIPDYRRSVATVCNNLALRYRATDRVREAEAMHRRALVERQKLAEAMPTVPYYRQLVGHSHFNLGILLLESDRRADALKALDTARGIFSELVDNFPPNASYRQDLAAVCNSLGNLRRAAGQYEAAAAMWQQALELQTKLVDDFPEEDEYRYELAGSHSNLGLLQLHNRKQPADAQKSFAAAQKHLEKLSAKYPEVPEYHHLLAESLAGLAAVSREQKDWPAERQSLEEAMRHRQAALKSNPRSPLYRQRLLGAYRDIGEVLVQQGEHAALAKAAGEVAALLSDDAAGAFLGAALLGRAISVAQKDDKLAANERTRFAQKYGDRALDLLRQARQKGWKDAVPLRQLPDFQELRQRDDFKKLIEELDEP